MITASAPGKVILSGEHSVVYNQPALAGALDLRCRVRLKENERGLIINAHDLNQIFSYSIEELEKIKVGKTVRPGYDNLAGAVLSVNQDISSINYELDINSKIPIGAGLGSSAATSVSIVAAVREHLKLPFDQQLISKCAFEAEKIAHGTPSGIDNTTSSLGGLIRFESGKSKKINLKQDIPLLIVNSNVPRNTKTLVSAVRKRKEKVGAYMDNLIINMGILTNLIQDALKVNDIDLAGELFDINQGLLDAIGVNHPKLTELIHISRNVGAKGAKLTGAGGGGCFIILTTDEQKSSIIQSISLPGIDIYETKISSNGVMLE